MHEDFAKWQEKSSADLPYGSGLSLALRQNCQMALIKLKELRGDVTLEALSGDTGISVSQLSRYENGKRDPKLAHLEALASRFNTTVADLVETGHAPGHDANTIPVVGYVGAGAIYAPFDQTEIDRVEAPEWANENTVCAEIRGDSLGSLFDRWLVYYDEVHAGPSPGLIGKLCVIGLLDKRVMVKKITRGQVEGLYTLLSNFEPPIYDVAVEWCALVRNMAPR